MVFTLKKKSRQSITFGKTGLQCVNLWLKTYVEQQSETAFQQVNLWPNCCVRPLTETGLQHVKFLSTPALHVLSDNIRKLHYNSPETQ